jgi:DNA (cytosine-5)-methyltransferase 1
MHRSTSKYTVGCLFVAIGGFARAFQARGADVLWANEKDRFARDTFVANFPKVRHISTPVEDVGVAKHSLDPVDILTGGFPCQPFSIAGDKLGLKDERGMLFLHITRLIREFKNRKPKVLLLENVQHFLNHDSGHTFRRVQREIQKAGYWFSDKDAQVLNTATHTDIPQNRERIFMVALSCDHFPKNTFEFPEPLPKKHLRKVKDFLDLKTKAPESFYFQPSSQYYPLFVEAMSKGKPDSVYQLRRSYVRENRSDMCFTLMANMGEGGHNIPVIRDKWGIRKLTPRECARLQGYDDDWFVIPEQLSRTQICKQLGNSVTVPLVERLAERIIRALDARKAASGLQARGRSLQEV